MATRDELSAKIGQARETADIMGIPRDAPVAAAAPNANLSFSPQTDGGSLDIINSLMGQLEMAPTPEAPKVGFREGLTGALSDALTQRARVLAGAAPLPVAPFAAEQIRQRQVYEQRLQDSNEANRDLRNELRIMGAQQTIKVREREEIRQQKLQDQLDAETRDAEARYRANLANEVMDRSLIPKGRDLSTMSTKELSDILSNQDPKAELAAVMASIPEGYEAMFHVDKNGRVSVSNLRRKGTGVSGGGKGGIPSGMAGLLAAMVKEGADVTPFLPMLPEEMRRPLVDASLSYAERRDREQAKFALEDLTKIDPAMVADPSIQGLIFQANDLLGLVNAGADTESVVKYYFTQVDAATDAINSGGLSLAQAESNLSNLRGMIRKNFGQEALDAIDSSKRGQKLKGTMEDIKTGQQSFRDR